LSCGCSEIRIGFLKTFLNLQKLLLIKKVSFVNLKREGIGTTLERVVARSADEVPIPPGGVKWRLVMPTLLRKDVARRVSIADWEGGSGD
jgi:hypothetical protein